MAENPTTNAELKRLKQQIRETLKTNNESLRIIPTNEPRKRIMCYAETLTRIDLLVRGVECEKVTEKSTSNDILSSELRKVKELEKKLKTSIKRLDEKIQEWKASNEGSLLPERLPLTHITKYLENSMNYITVVMCPDCQRTLKLYAKRGTKEGTFMIWQERCSCKMDMTKIDRASALWYKVKDLRGQLAIPRHKLLRITQSMTNDERIVFYKRVGV